MRAYLDNNATTAVDPRAVREMFPFFETEFGNASSLHGWGQRARSALEDAREKIARLVGAESSEIILTSGGTEADNSAVRGIARSFSARGKGDHIVTTRTEHPAVLRVCEDLEAEGFRVTYLPVDSEGLIALDDLASAVDDETVLISVMYANNETGVIQPLEEVCRLAAEKGVLVHTDAVQAAAKIPLDVGSLPVGLLSISAHKLHGPKGIGALYVRRGVELDSFQLGGGQERNRRGGTENVPGAVGFGTACELGAESLGEMSGRVRSLRDRLEMGILEHIDGTVVNGCRTRRMPHATNISFEGVDGEALLVALDFEGVAVSTGAACASGSVSPSHVLVAMGLDEKRIQGAIRFSLSRMTGSEEVDHVLEVLPRLVGRIREASGAFRKDV